MLVWLREEALGSGSSDLVDDGAPLAAAGEVQEGGEVVAEIGRGVEEGRRREEGIAAGDGGGRSCGGFGFVGGFVIGDGGRLPIH